MGDWPTKIVVGTDGSEEAALALRAAASLLSPAASYITGVSLQVDGGLISAVPWRLSGKPQGEKAPPSTKPGAPPATKKIETPSTPPGLRFVPTGYISRDLAARKPGKGGVACSHD